MNNQVQPKPRSRRLNTRALIVLAAILVASVPGLFLLKVARDRFGRTNFLKEAKTQLDKNNPSIALGFLNEYLALAPDDLDALDLKSKILFDSAHDPTQALEALKVHSLLLGAKTDDPHREAARRRTVKLNLMIPGRAPAALETARQLKGDDAEAHRLKARALAGVGVIKNDPASLDEARKEYLAAENKEPGDVESAEELAEIYRTRLDDPTKALEVLDNVVRTTAGTPEKHAAALLARARHYVAVRATARDKATIRTASRAAAADVDQATRDDPDGLMPRLVAAEVAIQSRDIDGARHHLAAISESKRNDRRVKIVEGLIELAEARPDEAIKSWRSGLMQLGGNDATLTWQLAHVLLDVNRISDAAPLIDQYRRLVGGEEPDSRYRYLHALSLLKSNKPAEAATELAAIRYKTPKTLEPHLLYTLGQSYEAIRETGKAVESYRAAAEASQGWAEPWSALARLQSVDKPLEAVATLQKGLTLIPNDPQLLTDEATLLFREEMKKPAESRSLAEVDRLLAQAAKASPGSPAVALARAQFYAATGDNENALQTLQAASRINPHAIDLWLARANLLARTNRLGDAETVLREAASAGGNFAVFYTTRAQFLVAKGEIVEARKALVEGLGKVAKEQKPLIWKTLGELYHAQKDDVSARDAFDEWAKLQPINPEPRLALFRLAMAKGDEPTITASIEGLRKVGGDRSYFWRLAKVEDLLRVRAEAPDAERDVRRLEEASKLIKEIETNDPQLALGYLLEGRLEQGRKKPEPAIAAYRKALDLGAGEAALKPLVTLLAAAGRDSEIDRLRATAPALSMGIDRIATTQALVGGNPIRAEELAQKAVDGDPQGLNTRVWQAEVLQALGKPKDAEAKARKLVADRPEEPTPWIVLLMLQVNAGNRSEAAATVEQMRLKVKTERSELLMAQCYRAVGNLRKAAESMREALRRWPNDLAVLGSAVAFYEQIGQRDAAEDVLRTVLRRDPTNIPATRKLAVSLASKSADRAAWDEAIALVGPEKRPNDTSDDQVIRASIYARAPEPSQRRKAVTIVEGLLSEFPDRVDLHDQVARLLLALGDPAAARPHAARAALGDQATPDSVLFYAGVLLALDDLTAAQDQLARLAKLEPNGLAVAELEARILAAQGKPADGAAILEKAFAEHASLPDGLATGEKMVQLLASLKQNDAAERVARRIAEIAPRGRCVLAELLAGTGKIDEAVSQLEQAAKAGDPASAGYIALALAARTKADPRWLTLADKFLAPPEGAPTFQSLERVAQLRHLEGKYVDEIDTYRKMLDLKPENYLFLNNMAWTLSEELHKPDEALECVNNAVEKVGAQPHILDTRGVILTRLGKYADAVRDLENASQNLRDPSVFFHLARAYKKLGKPAETRKNRERALKAGLVPDQLQPSERADWNEVNDAS